MIDYEDMIVSRVKDAVKAAFPDVTVYDETLLSPSALPCVCIEEIDSYTYDKTIDSGSNENHVRVAYEVNIYTNRTRNKHGECKRIFSVVSDAFTGMGFARLSKNPQNFDNATKYRLIGRFSGVVSKDGNIFRR